MKACWILSSVHLAPSRFTLNVRHALVAVAVAVAVAVRPVLGVPRVWRMLTGILKQQRCRLQKMAEVEVEAVLEQQHPVACLKNKCCKSHYIALSIDGITSARGAIDAITSAACGGGMLPTPLVRFILLITN